MAVTRTAPGLRDAMFELLDGLRNRTVKRADALAQCEVARRIMETVQMEATEIHVMEAGLRLEKMMVEAARPVVLIGDGGRDGQA